MTRFARLLLFVLVAGLGGGAAAQGAPGAAPPANAARAGAGLDVLKGAWIRTDGGYVILIRNVAADGQLDATYFNPATLPFARPVRSAWTRRSGWPSNCAPATTRARRTT